MADLVFDPKKKVMVPAGIAQLGASKDAYLRKLKNTCGCCGAEFVLDTSDSPTLCGLCFDVAGIENEIQDGTPLAERQGALNAIYKQVLAQGGKLDNMEYPMVEAAPLDPLEQAQAAVDEMKAQVARIVAYLQAEPAAISCAAYIVGLGNVTVYKNGKVEKGGAA